MRCNKCGTENSGENKFCINCGNELTKMNHQDNNICESCGSANDFANKYCIGCGEKLKILNNTQPENVKQNIHHRQKQGKHKSKNNSNSTFTSNKKQAGMTIGIKPLLIAVGVLFVSFTIVAVLNKWFYKSEEELYPKESTSSNPVVEAKVFEIASKFVCSCGTCGEQSLENCKCATAVEERQFVRNYLENNQKNEDIIFALASRYGYLKSQYAGDFKQIDKSKIFETSQITIPPVTRENKIIELGKKATISDRVEIYSEFKCNCGKCGIDELKDCNCPHPKGAQEVKKFIDEKISTNKYTVQEVIGLVNSKYGGKKI